MSPSDESVDSHVPLVSVLVPAYNHQQYIEYCLDSITASSYSRLEILVLDDGSSDQTYVRARSWMERNKHRAIRIAVYQQQNQGLTRVLNSLVEKARGEYVTVLASDDALFPDGIALRVSKLREHPEWLAVFGDCSVIDSYDHEELSSALEDMYHAHIPSLLNPKSIARELILRWSVVGPAMLVKRSAYEPDMGVGSYNDELQVEDRDFYLRLLSRDALGFLPERVAQYRWHGTNSTLLNRTNMLRDGAIADRRNIASFRGINRCLLMLVAARSYLRFHGIVQNEQGVKILGFFLKLCGQLLAGLTKIIYVVHRVVD